MQKPCENCKGTGKIGAEITIPIWHRLNEDNLIEFVNQDKLDINEAYDEGRKLVRFLSKNAHGKFFDGLCDEIKENHPKGDWHK